MKYIQSPLKQPYHVSNSIIDDGGTLEEDYTYFLMLNYGDYDDDDDDDDDDNIQHKGMASKQKEWCILPLRIGM